MEGFHVFHGEGVCAVEDRLGFGMEMTVEGEELRDERRLADGGIVVAAQVSVRAPTTIFPEALSIAKGHSVAVVISSLRDEVDGFVAGQSEEVDLVFELGWERGEGEDLLFRQWLRWLDRRGSFGFLQAFVRSNSTILGAVEGTVF